MRYMGERFQTTRWSLVIDTRNTGPESERALNTLCQDYWRPLHHFAIHLGASHADAEDYVQGFFANAIRSELFERADPTRGKLRTFLLTAFRRYIQDQWSKRNAQRRGGNLRQVIFDNLDELPADTHEIFDREWGATVMEHAMDRLKERYTQEEKMVLYEHLQPYLATPVPSGKMIGLATDCKLSESAAKVALHRLRKRFGEALRAEVADTLPDGEDVEAELQYLTNLLGSN